MGGQVGEGQVAGAGDSRWEPRGMGGDGKGDRGREDTGEGDKRWGIGEGRRPGSKRQMIMIRNGDESE